MVRYEVRVAFIGRDDIDSRIRIGVDNIHNLTDAQNLARMLRDKFIPVSDTASYVSITTVNKTFEVSY